MCRRKGYHLIPDYHLRKIQNDPKSKDVMVGQVLDKRYLLVRKIGSGGMGNVFIALQKPFNREVAIKLKVVSGLDITVQLRTRFEREAMVLSRLNHPNIVKLLDYGIQYVSLYEAEVPFMVLEYVDGGIELGQFFKQLRKTHRQISRDTLLHIFDQVLDALASAHAMGLVHRDIKPANIMLKKVKGNPFFVKLLDFGLVKVVGGAVESNEDLTRGLAVGTPQYMAPEQVQYGTKIDHRADLYSVGTILFEILCGTRPFPGKEAVEMLKKKMNPRYDPLELPQAKALPASIRKFLKKAMAPKVKARFSSAEEFKEALRSAVMGTKVTVKGLVTTDISTTKSEKVYDSSTLIRAGDAGGLKSLTGYSGHNRRGSALILPGLIVLGAVIAAGLILRYNSRDAHHDEQHTLMLKTVVKPKTPKPLPRPADVRPRVVSRRMEMNLPPVLANHVESKPSGAAHHTDIHTKRHVKPRRKRKRMKKNGWKFLP